MTGTTSEWLPSGFDMSTARPRFTVSFTISRGLPSAPSAKVLRITGTASAIARTTA